MPQLLIHLAAVERLAARPESLPSDFAKALNEDLQYARFGAALPELPWFGSVRSSLAAFAGWGTRPRLTARLTDEAPVAFGFKLAELVANGALVGNESGRAVVAGYFTQLCVSRAFAPVVRAAATATTLRGRTRVEWSLTLHLLDEMYGSPLVGTRALLTKLQLRKGRLRHGVGRGLYELTRVAWLKALGESPSKGQVDAWMRGLSAYALALSSPVGALIGLLVEKSTLGALGTIDAGLAHARELLDLMGHLIRRNSFTNRAWTRVIQLVPEGSPDSAPRALASGSGLL